MPCFTTRRTLSPRGQQCRMWGLLTFTAVILSHAAAWAVPISSWTFETSPPAGSTNHADYPNPINADSGPGTASGHHFDAGTDWSAPTGNGSSYSFAASFWNSSDYFQFVVPTTGYEDITVSWDMTRSSENAPDYFELRYSTTGPNGTFSVGLDDFTVSVFASWSTFFANLSSIAQLNNNADVVFRLVAVDGALSETATVRVDNFVVSGVAVPEPASFGMLLVGGAWILFRRRRKR